MKKKIYRFQWNDESGNFTGPSLEDADNKVRVSIETINKEIKRESGIRRRKVWPQLIIFLLIVLCGFTISFLLITNNNQSAGGVFLVLTPILAFCGVARSILKKKRSIVVREFFKRKTLEFNSLLRPLGFLFDSAVMENGRICIKM